MKLTSKTLKITQGTQTRLLALLIAISAAWTGLFAINGKAELSASLVKSLPPAQAQLFPLQKSIATIQASQAGKVRKALPKQAPKFRVKFTLNVQVTGYNSEVGQTDGSPWYTADGTWCTEGVAAGPYALPFGTKFRIPSLFGDRIFTVHDRSATPSGHVDIWFRHYHDAIQFGRRTATIEVLG
ncbi:MAG: 3D domain-containing protein [Candidatus Andersenbacteria bacterium]